MTRDCINVGHEDDVTMKLSSYCRATQVYKIGCNLNQNAGRQYDSSESQLMGDPIEFYYFRIL